MSTEVVPGDEQLDEAVGEVVDSLLKNGPQAQAECKALLRIIAGQPIDESTLEETAQRITYVRASPEGQEGLNAFLENEKRTGSADNCLSAHEAYKKTPACRFALCQPVPA